MVREQAAAVAGEIEKLGGERVLCRVPVFDRRPHGQAQLFALLGPPVDGVRQQQAKRFRADARLDEEVDAELAKPDAERKEVLAVNGDPDRLARKRGQVDRALQGQDALHGRDDHVGGTFEILANHVAAQVLELDLEVLEHPLDPKQVPVVQQQHFGARIHVQLPGEEAQIALRPNREAP